MDNHNFIFHKTLLEKVFDIIHKYIVPLYYIVYFTSELIEAITHPEHLDVKGVLIITGFLLIVFYIGYAFYKERKLKKWQRTKVAILLPLSSKKNNDYVKGDVLLQLSGFSKVFFERDNISNEFDFKILDHQNEYERAMKILESEFELGTKYFVTTMSQVSNELAKFVKETYGSKKMKPILISTVSGSNSINKNLNNDNIFRFYIRISEEIETLLHEAKMYRNVGLIVVPSEYGRKTKEVFTLRWNNTRKKYMHEKFDDDNDCLILPEDLSETPLESFFSRNIQKINDKEVLLIALYGNTIYETIRIIDKLNIRPKLLLFTSTFHYQHSQSDLKDVLKKYQWKTCIPKLRDGNVFKEEVVKDFTYRTIDRLCKTIRDLKRMEEREFSDLWNEHKPKDLMITDEIGDSKIEMQIVTERDYN